MAISLKHKFVSVKPEPVDPTLIKASNWNEEHEFTMMTARMLGRASAAAGVVEELDALQVKEMLGLSNVIFMHNVKDFGAKADHNPADPASSTDNSPFFQAAMNMAKSTGGTVFVPAGKYWFSNAVPLDPGVGGFSMVGEYDNSILYWDGGTYDFVSGTGTQQHLIMNYMQLAKKPMYFRNLKFHGDFEQRGTDGGGTAVYLDHYPQIHFSYCQWKFCPWICNDIHFSEHVTWDHCIADTNARDCCRARECKFTSVHNCIFHRMGDDAISFHGGGYDGSYDPDDGSPRHEGLIVTGCQFLDGISSVTALGGRTIIVSNNIANRISGAFFFGPNDPSGFNEGITPVHSILISDNIILNSVGGVFGPQALINVTGLVDPRAGTGGQTGGIVPGMPDSSGVFSPVWGTIANKLDNADMNDPIDAYPTSQDVVIRNNIIARRLPPVAKYSDWGFGTLGRHQYPYDPAITDDIMRPIGVSIIGHLRSRIEGNTISHVTVGIAIKSFLNSATLFPPMVAALVRGNTIFDATTACVSIGSTGFNDLIVEDNILYGDVYRKAANSNADGTYDANAGPYGVLNSGDGAIIRNNKIGYVCNPISNLNTNMTENNIIVAQVAATGFSTANKGVGIVWDEASFGFNYIHVYCDPMQSNYGKLINIQASSASAMPTTGYYVRGHVVRNSNIPSSQLGYVKEWVRLTTGNTHVVDVDWKPIIAESERLTGIVTYNPGSLADGAGETTTVTVTGAAMGDIVEGVSFGLDLQGIMMTAWVSAVNTVSVRFQNETGGTLDLGQANIRVLVRSII